MSDRLREILANGLVSANYKQDGENFVRVDFKCPNEANDFFRALTLITVTTLEDESENDLGKVDNGELLTWAAANINEWDNFEWSDLRSEATKTDPFFSIGSWVAIENIWSNQGPARIKHIKNGIRTKHPQVITYEEWKTARSHYLAMIKHRPEKAPETKWQPMETAPKDGTVIEILFQMKPFKDAIHRCLYTQLDITHGAPYGWIRHHDGAWTDPAINYAKGWRPINEQ